MRVDALHRRIVDDVCVLHSAVREHLPVQLPPQYQTRALSLRAFVDRLNSVTEKHGVFNEIETDLEVEPGQIVISGLWLDESELPENDSRADIRMLFHVHPDSKRFKLTAAEWQRRRFFWWQLVMHELIHRHQDTYRHTKTRVFKAWTTQRNLKVEQEYYGDYDEIETHSHNAAVELYVWWPDLSMRDAIAQATHYSGRLVVPTYNMYVAAFAETPAHPALRIFKRKLKAWYELIRKNNHIYHLLELPKLV